jgi:TPR repeat protein
LFAISDPPFHNYNGGPTQWGWTNYERQKKEANWFEKKWLEKIRPELLPLAENGDAKAQIILADTYSSYPQNSMNEALKWYRKAAAQGRSEAQFRIGRALHNRDNFKKDKYKKTENGGDKLVHGSGGIFPAAGGIKPCHL